MSRFLTVLILATVATGASGAQTGPSRRVLAADYSVRRIALVNEAGKIEWEYPIHDLHDAWLLANGNLLLQTNWTRVLELDPKQQVVWQYDAAESNGNLGKRVEVHGFQRLDDGNTMIAESGPARIIEVAPDGTLVREVKLKVDRPDPHHDTRQVRKLSNGHYLVAHENDGVVREYDATGKVTWEYGVGSQVYSAIRLETGHTLIGCGNGHRVLEVTASGQVVWSIDEHDLPGITLAWVTMVDRLSNGNTMLVNCHAGPANPQILEVTPDKKVVWTFRDFEHFGNALPVARVIPNPASNP